MVEHRAIRYEPIDVVTDAVMSAFGKEMAFIAPRALAERKFTMRDTPFWFEECFADWTELKCVSASIYALWNIATHPESNTLFDRYFLLERFDHGDVVEHAYFLVQAKNGTWFIGCPSNYSFHKNDETFTISSGTLMDVIPAMGGRFGANVRWPRVEELAKAVNASDRVVPHISSRTSNHQGTVTAVVLKASERMCSWQVEDVEFNFSKKPVVYIRGF